MNLCKFFKLIPERCRCSRRKKLSIQITSYRLDNFVRITFTDNGTGIPPAIQEYIFDPFFSTKDSGTGLGLAVTKKLFKIIMVH